MQVNFNPNYTQTRLSANSAPKSRAYTPINTQNETDTVSFTGLKDNKKVQAGVLAGITALTLLIGGNIKPNETPADTSSSAIITQEQIDAMQSEQIEHLETYTRGLDSLIAEKDESIKALVDEINAGEFGDEESVSKEEELENARQERQSLVILKACIENDIQDIEENGPKYSIVTDKNGTQVVLQQENDYPFLPQSEEN